MIDCSADLQDKLIPISKAGELFETGHSPHSFGRWVRAGVRNSQGETVKLGSVRVGGRVFTSRKMVEEFLARLQAGSGEEP